MTVEGWTVLAQDEVPIPRRYARIIILPVAIQKQFPPIADVFPASRKLKILAMAAARTLRIGQSLFSYAVLHG
jgi:hypothetical protein